jgi:hypothetical protein
LYYIYEGPLPESEEWPFDSVRMLPGLRKIHEQLEDQGFIPLAVVSVKTKLSSQPVNEWQYTNSESTIWVEAIQINVEAPAMAQYSSIFDDNAMILTRFPIGGAFATPNFHAQFAAKDLDAAYQYHAQKVREWTRTHGEPRLVMSQDDVKAYDTIYHKTHRQLDLSKFIWGYAAQAVVALITAIVMLYNGRMLENTSWSSIGILFLGMTLGVITHYVPSWIEKLRFGSGTALDNRKMKPKQRRAS